LHSQEEHTIFEAGRRFRSELLTSRRLKLLARELQIPILALCQLNRSSEDRQDHRPRLADLRDSGSLEQDADTVLLLYREGQTKTGETKTGEVYPVEVIIAKQRNGPDGQLTLGFRRSCMRFENWIPDATVVDGCGL
jgi:replicative DNA helicase